MARVNEDKRKDIGEVEGHDFADGKKKLLDALDKIRKQVADGFETHGKITEKFLLGILETGEFWRLTNPCYWNSMLLAKLPLDSMFTIIGADESYEDVMKALIIDMTDKQVAFFDDKALGNVALKDQLDMLYDIDVAKISDYNEAFSSNIDVYRKRDAREMVKFGNEDDLKERFKLETGKNPIRSGKETKVYISWKESLLMGSQDTFNEAIDDRRDKRLKSKDEKAPEKTGLDPDELGGDAEVI